MLTLVCLSCHRKSYVASLKVPCQCPYCGEWTLLHMGYRDDIFLFPKPISEWKEVNLALKAYRLSRLAPIPTPWGGFLWRER